MCPPMALSALPVLEKLEWLKGELGTWTKVSKALGFTRAYVWDILNGRREPGPNMYKALHFEKQCELVDLDPQRILLAKIVRENKD